MGECKEQSNIKSAPASFFAFIFPVLWLPDTYLNTLITILPEGKKNRLASVYNVC